MAAKGRYRNALRSRRLLREAFSELLAEGGFDAITVKELAQRADLNRSTFYAHYADIHELAAELMEEIARKMFDVIDRASDGTFLENPRPVLDNVGEQLVADRKVYSNLILAEGADAYLSNLQRELQMRMRALISEQADAQLTLKLLSTVDYLAGGLFSMYRSWLKGSYGDLRLETLTDIAVECVQASGAVVRRLQEGGHSAARFSPVA